MKMKPIMHDIRNYLDLETIRESFQFVQIFGAGKLGKGEGYLLLTLAGFKIDGYYDNYVDDNKVVNGIIVKGIDDLLKKGEEILVFVCMSSKYRKEIINQFEREKITNYYFIDTKTIAQVMESIDSAGEDIKTRYRELYDDKSFISMKFMERVGYSFDINNPRTFNEKLQYLKIHDRKNIYIGMVDKYEVKRIVAEKIGKDHIIPTIGIWDKFENIDFNLLPKRFVLKCTHDSGSIEICRDKNKIDKGLLREKFTKCLETNNYWQSREWPYKNVVPRIIAEKIIEDDEWGNLPVYKFFCFSGVVGIIQFILNDKTKTETVDYYDIYWNKLSIHQNFPNSKIDMAKPKKLDEMLRLASVLSNGIPFVRVDFYCVRGQIYFSEFTFFSDSGFERFYPQEWDNKLGKMLDIGRI